MSKITSEQVVEILLGKTLTYAEMRELFIKKHPEWDFPGKVLAPKLRSVVHSLMRSPHADIEQFIGRENRYHLRQVTPDFYRKGGYVKGIKTKKIGTDGRTQHKVRPSMPPEDAECCRMTTIFNQLLKPVRQRYLTMENRA